MALVLFRVQGSWGNPDLFGKDIFLLFAVLAPGPGWGWAERQSGGAEPGRWGAHTQRQTPQCRLAGWGAGAQHEVIPRDVCPGVREPPVSWGGDAVILPAWEFFFNRTALTSPSFAPAHLKYFKPNLRSWHLFW